MIATARGCGGDCFAICFVANTITLVAAISEKMRYKTLDFSIFSEFLASLFLFTGLKSRLLRKNGADSAFLTVEFSIFSDFKS